MVKAFDLQLSSFFLQRLLFASTLLFIINCIFYQNALELVVYYFTCYRTFYIHKHKIKCVHYIQILMAHTVFKIVYLYRCHFKSNRSFFIYIRKFFSCRFCKSDCVFLPGSSRIVVGTLLFCEQKTSQSNKFKLYIPIMKLI